MSQHTALDASGKPQLLSPWRVERILRDDEDFLVVEKPIGIPVHGGDESLADDLVHRLAAWLVSTGRDDYLGVHQRLDRATSGVIFFTRRRELNAAVAEAMREHRIRRTYFAVVRLGDGHRLAQKGRLEHQLRHVRGRTEVLASARRGAGQRAVTDYELIERRGARALVRLAPQTGRTHQLRAQLAAVSAPICGDELYAGEPAPRLFLHAAELSGGPLGKPSRSELPGEFRDWLETGALRLPGAAGCLLRDAGLRRSALAGQTTTYRLVNGSGDLLPGVVVDVYGGFVVLSLYDQPLPGSASGLAAELAALGFRGVYLKTRVRADLRQREPSELASEAPLVGEAAPGGGLVVEEHGMRFEVALADGLSTGLFVDQRDNRQRIRAASAGQRVLNLFSYTCSFSVAAALGGAREVVSVDLSGRALQRGRRNFELNGLEPGEHRFFKEDAVKWLGRAARRGERFGLIVLDPPSFSTVGKGTFSVDKSYGHVASLALALLEPGGRLLAVTNHTKTSVAGLRRTLHGAAAAVGRGLVALRDAPSGLDCPHGAMGPWPSKSVLATVDGGADEQAT